MKQENSYFVFLIQVKVCLLASNVYEFKKIG